MSRQISSVRSAEIEVNGWSLNECSSEHAPGTRTADGRSTPDQLIRGEPNIFRDLPKQWRRDITPFVHGDGRPSSTGVSILDVRTALANSHETQYLQSPADFLRLEDWQRATHRSADCDAFRADKFRLELGLAIFEQHLDYLTEV